MTERQENPDADQTPEEGQELREQREQKGRLEVDPSAVAHKKQVELAEDLRSDADRKSLEERAALAREAEGGVDLDKDEDTDENSDQDLDIDPSAEDSLKKEGEVDAEVEPSEGPKLIDQLKLVFSTAKKPGWDPDKSLLGNLKNVDWGKAVKAAGMSTGILWHKFWDKFKGLFKGKKRNRDKANGLSEDVEYDLSNKVSPIQWPTNGRVSSDIQESRTLTVDGETKTRPHSGIDLGFPMGTPLVWSLEGGKVLRSRQTPHSSAGYLVDVLHNGIVFRFLHLQFASSLKVGQTIGKGTLIGKVGSTGRSTGAHLHFEARKHEKDSWPYGEATDPFPYLGGKYQQELMAQRKSVAANKGVDSFWDVIPEENGSALV